LISTPITLALEEGRSFWDRHARRDPLWAILSEARNRDGQWEAAAFFDSGVDEIRSLFFELGSLGIDCGRHAALDFGCGVGRLTQALASHFERVVGVDISVSMQELATSSQRTLSTSSSAASCCSTFSRKSPRRISANSAGFS
jgi:2-polyprenyl-3-methyl-5-hydroxy-6-metoxy-1,4-benzoquinol methylase